MKYKPLQTWYIKANAKQRVFLANHLDFDRAYLYQIAYGLRPISAEKAILIESGTKLVHDSDPAMPIITQPQVCSACSHCPYTK